MSIIDKTVYNQIWKYDTETKKYLNPITNKWVGFPRVTQKGEFKGLSKGKNIGKSIGKSIGKNTDKEYIKEFGQLTTLYTEINSDFTLHKPFNLSKEEILNLI